MLTRITQRSVVTALAAILLVPVVAAAAEKFVLVEDGVAGAPIVIFQDAPPRTRQAADELAQYMEKVSGAKPDIIEGEPDPIPEHAVWVGYQPVMDDLFPGLDFDFQHPEEILIAANENHLAIAGRDVWDPENMTGTDRRGREIVGVQLEYGTINAVYTFLQDYLDVRWIWPGELGEDVLERETIAFEPFEYRYHPQIRARAGIFPYSVLGRRGGRGDKTYLWSRFQRLQLDSLYFSGGHAYTDWWERFKDTHRDYFAMQPDGTRGGYPNPRTVKLCQSNPAVWDQWLADVEAQIEEHPNRTVFNGSPNDGWASGHCICEDCRAWDHPDGELRSFRWAGMGQKYVALSDRFVTFANHLARKLKERYPDRDYYVKMGAYGHSRPAPIEAVPDDNVIISSVALFLLAPNRADRGSPNGTLHRDQFRDWAKVSRNMVWRPNKARDFKTSMPLVGLTQTIEDVRFVAENNGIGIFVDMIWQHWAIRGPFYYIMAQMAWNPWQDGEAMLDDYFRRGFGEAAEDMRAYWRFTEQKWRESLGGNPEPPELLDAEFFDKAYSLLDAAARAVEDEPEKYRRRVEFVRVGLDYTRLLTEARAMMIRFKESGGKDKEAEARAREIWVDEIYPLATNEEYPHAIKWNRTAPGHGHMKKGGYYFPEELSRKSWQWWREQKDN